MLPALVERHPYHGETSWGLSTEGELTLWWSEDVGSI